MTDEEIIEMARRANLPSCLATHPKSLKRFAKLVAAKEREEFAVHAVDIARRAVAQEREACAKVADKISDKYAWGYSGNEVDTADEIAVAIRARGKT